MHYTEVYNLHMFQIRVQTLLLQNGQPERGSMWLTLFWFIFVRYVGFLSQTRSNWTTSTCSSKDDFYALRTKELRQLSSGCRSRRLQHCRSDGLRIPAEGRRSAGGAGRHPLPFDYCCQFCALHVDMVDGMDDHHVAFQGRFFCAVEEVPGGRTPLQWLKEKRVVTKQSQKPPWQSSFSSPLTLQLSALRQSV